LDQTAVQRLGKNIDRYSGETIDLGAVLADCVAAAEAGPLPAELMDRIDATVTS